MGLNDSFTLVAYVHYVSDVNPPVCSCMHAGWFFFYTDAHTYTLCQPHSVGSFSISVFISEMERGDAAERDGDMTHTSRREMKIN